MGKSYSKISFHQGEGLIHLAKTYPMLQDAIIENVQNALDEDATRIWIDIRYHTKFAVVRDNGNGASIDKFNRALTSICRTMKKDGKLGQFGIGLISPLGKCKLFTFTSCPKPHKNLFQRWTLETRKIKEQESDIAIPSETVTNLTLDRETAKTGSKVLVDWRTEIAFTQFDPDAYQNQVKMDDLISSILDRFAVRMRRTNVVISVSITDKHGAKEERHNVTAPSFRGKSLPEQVVEESDAGKTTFRLFVAKQTTKGRNGKVLMGVAGNDFRFPFHYFARAVTDLLREDVVTALSSGLFEGEILSEKAELMPNRQAFQKNDAFIGLCLTIEEWFDRYGAKHVEEVRQSREEQRYQELGLHSMGVIENLLKAESFLDLLRVVKSFTRGTIGPGHAKLPTVGEQAMPSVSTDGNPGQPRNTDGDSDSHERRKPRKEKPGHMPGTVQGPEGTRRKLVRGSSLGLQFAYDGMEHSNDLWRLDMREGVLTFNTRHPLWVKCDVRDTVICKLQELIAIQALSLQRQPEQVQPHQRKAMDDTLYFLADWLLDGDKLRSAKKRAKARADKK